MISRILVPTDGSELAEKAGAYAISLARDNKASIVFLSVVDELAPAYAFETETGVNPNFPQLTEQLNRAAHAFVTRLETQAAQAGVASVALVTEGHPWEEILAEAERQDCDLIVLGSHGRRGLAAALLGSVTTNVIHKTRIPVTIVPE
ncbi:MAG: universal stress protein [Thermoleophilia bacterium]|jgi:nucleotide-binding universal stress UspA family protein|nr:universal stress protein [Actinomycetota bacterium]MDA8166519.1 universal stress protein [Actinomycetota bacterium]